jgi:hypothetical protein
MKRRHADHDVKSCEECKDNIQFHAHSGATSTPGGSLTSSPEEIGRQSLSTNASPLTPCQGFKLKIQLHSLVNTGAIQQDNPGPSAESVTGKSTSGQAKRRHPDSLLANGSAVIKKRKQDHPLSSTTLRNDEYESDQTFDSEAGVSADPGQSSVSSISSNDDAYDQPELTSRDEASAFPDEIPEPSDKQMPVQSDDQNTNSAAVPQDDCGKEVPIPGTTKQIGDTSAAVIECNTKSRNQINGEREEEAELAKQTETDKWMEFEERIELSPDGKHLLITIID